MKISKYTAIIAAVAAAGVFSSCENGENEFPDFEDGVSVYFAKQYPVRTLVMGDDTYDTSLDNAHRCRIYATMGGAYKGRDITLEIAADPTLVEHLTWDGTRPVKAMPESYYKLGSNTISYGGSHMGYVEVEFTDAFFADPEALANNYVIPVVIKSQKGADRILSGTPAVEGDNPPRCNSDAWSEQPKDFVLYGVKYNTQDLRTALYPVSTVITLPDGNKQTLTCELKLSFDDNDQCTIVSNTDGYTAAGNGKFVRNGEKNSWGNKDRNALYLEYTVDFGSRKIETLDTLVVKSRNVTGEYFTPQYKN